jgi:hypothetical protein
MIESVEDLLARVAAMDDLTELECELAATLEYLLTGDVPPDPMWLIDDEPDPQLARRVIRGRHARG